MTEIETHTSQTEGNDFSKQPYYLTAIIRELEKRCAKNSSYSLRAFAKSLDIDAGSTSRIIRFKQIPTFEMATRIIPHLSLSQAEENRFYKSVEQVRRKHNLSSNDKPIKLLEQPPSGVTSESYESLADWYYSAICELVRTDHFDAAPEAVARALKISVTNASLALERLCQTGLLKKVGQSYERVEDQVIMSPPDVTGKSQRKNQIQFLEKAIFSVENDPFGKRVNRTMTMAIDPAKLAEADIMVREFLINLSHFLESGRKTQVFNLVVGLNPLQRD